MSERTEEKAVTERVIEAAGGVLWRAAGAELEVAVVHRPKYDDWSLPKGKLTKDEHPVLGAVREVQEETGYQWIQGTRPQTLAYGLTDSPAGLAAWIVEKFRRWTDCGGTIESAVSRDRMLGNIAFYWFTGAINSSFCPYYDRRHGEPFAPPGEKVGVPLGYAEFPHEIARPPPLFRSHQESDQHAGGDRQERCPHRMPAEKLG